MTTPHAARCHTDPDYHKKLRADPALFDRDAIPIGIQHVGPGEESLVLGRCRGCGTTVARAPEGEKVE